MSLSIVLYYVLVSYAQSTTDVSNFRNIGFIKTGSTIIAHQLYYSSQAFKVGDFDANLLGGWYTYNDGKHISKNNLLSYKGHILPINVTAASNADYLGTSAAQQIGAYIQNFIILDDQVLQENKQEVTQVVPLTEPLQQAFKLDCLESKLKIIPDFCEHNLELFSQNLRKYDVDKQFQTILNIFKNTNNEIIRTNICQSITDFEFLSNKIDGRFREILNACDAKFISTHDNISKRTQITKQLSTRLDSALEKDDKRNQFKLVSSMQIIQSELDKNKIDMGFLDSYREFVNQLLSSSSIDQFTVDLIYKYHNQYLMKGLLEVQKLVNLDAVQDIQNTLDKFDTMNNGDNLNLIGLRYRVSPEIQLPDDYAQEHPPLEADETQVVSGSQSSGVDASVINTVIGQVDTAILHLGSSGNNESTQYDLTGSSSTGGEKPSNTATNTTDTTPSQSNSNSVPNNITSSTNNTNNKEEDLNTYQPQKTTTIYQPVDSESKEKIVVSDRMYNNLGIKPSAIIRKGTKYLVMRSYSNFEFAALIDKENDRKMSPIYVKLDNHLSIIPELEIYLMNYDRYTQIKFLKNPDQYVRNATQ